MKLSLIVVALVVMVVLVEAMPQNQQQQQQQQQRRRQQQQQQQRQGAGGAQRQGAGGAQRQGAGGAQRQGAGGQRQRPGAANAGGQRRRRPGQQGGKKKIPLHLDPNLTLSKISQKNLDDFLGSAEAVNELVNCFESLRKCKARAGISLVRDVRSLGKGGTCSKCSTAERAHTRKLVGNAIAGLQQKHPEEWKRLLPEIGFLL